MTEIVNQCNYLLTNQNKQITGKVNLIHLDVANVFTAFFPAVVRKHPVQKHKDCVYHKTSITTSEICPLNLRHLFQSQNMFLAKTVLIYICFT